jgi:hypothetical protein
MRVLFETNRPAQFFSPPADKKRRALRLNGRSARWERSRFLGRANVRIIINCYFATVAMVASLGLSCLAASAQDLGPKPCEAAYRCANKVPPSVSAKNAAEIIGVVGTWTAFVRGDMTLITKHYDDDASVGIAYGDGTIGLVFYSPTWHMKGDRRYEISLDVDGERYEGTGHVMSEHMLVLSGIESDVVKVLYGSRRVEIRANDDTFTLTSFADAAAAFRKTKLYRRTSGR